MKPSVFVMDLATRGIELRSEGERFVITPASLLSDTDRDYLREHRGEVLDALRVAEPAPPSICAVCGVVEALARADAYRDRLRAVSLRMAAELGYPPVQIRPGHIAGGGAYTWMKYTATATLPDLVDIVIPALRRQLDGFLGAEREAA